MNNKTKTLQIEKMVKINIFFLIAIICFYVYLVNLATFNTAKAQDLSEEKSFLQSEVSKLEVEYLEKTKSINIESAQNFNLISSKKDAKKVLVYRADVNKLTLNNN